MECFEQINQTAKYANDKKSIVFTDGLKKFSSKKLSYNIQTEKMDNLIKLIHQNYAKVRKSSTANSGVEISLTAKGREILKIMESMKKK